MTSRKRSGSGSKRQLKEKVVQIYESFFKGEDPTLGNPNFWDEFFLLKPKVASLEAEIQKLSADQWVSVKESINMLFRQCVMTLGHDHNIRVVYAMQTLCALVQIVYKKTSGEFGFDVINMLFRQCVMTLGHDHNIRVVYAMQTLCALVQIVYKKTSGEFGFDVINMLMGFEVAEKMMQSLLEHCNGFVTGKYPSSLKALCLKLLLVLVTGTENVSQNTLLEYIMMNSVFEALIQLLCEPATRVLHGHDAVLLLTLLVNYRKHEAANPYIVKLSILDNELALNGYGQVITSCLTDFCRQFMADYTEPQSAGWLSSLTNIVGNMFVSEEGGTRTQQIRANNAMLVALYEAVHLNRNFITTLAHTQTDSSVPPSPSNTLNASQPVPNLSLPPLDIISQPSNLLVTFFQYCSIVMQDTKSEASANNVKLCFLILTCIAEDQYANSLMHDVNLVFKVQLHRLPMRHRKLAPDKLAPSQPLAATLLDLLVEFLMSHMMKKLPMELYLHCMGVVHRVLCYQKKCRVRLNYQWKELWTALISLLKFLLANENHLARKMNIFNLALQVLNLFNLFITYGDTFLPSPSSYDELYYELIRMHQVFDNLYSMAMRYSTNDGEYKENALKLINSLINVRAIINHFSPKIESWLASQALSTPSEDQILEVVRKNYDSLTLKLHDSLDQYERYAEKPRHAAFFTSMVRSVVADTRQSIDFATLDLQVILQEFSSIS